MIYLNLVRSVRRILEAISPDYETLNSHIFDDYDDESTETASVIISSNEHTPSSTYHGIPGFEAYQSRLAPLLTIEQRLIAQLSDEEENEATRLPSSSKSHLNGLSTLHIPSSSHESSKPTSPIEIAVRTTSNWKKTLSLGGRMKSPKSPHSGELAGWWEDPEDPVHVINKCAPIMLELWKNTVVRQRLVDRKIRVEESSGL